MYTVKGQDGRDYPADLATLESWAAEGRIHAATIIIDSVTGQYLRADQLLPLQRYFAAAAPPGAVPGYPPPPGQFGNPYQTPTRPPSTPFHQQGWFVVASVLLCIPAALVSLWLHPRAKTGVKVALTVVGVGLMVLNYAVMSAMGSFSPSSSSSSYSTVPAAAPAAEEPKPEPTAPEADQLKLVKWTWGESDSSAFVSAEGQVKNLTNEPLENVEAVVSFYDKKGDFITSSDALIEYNPILPGQVSPFKVLVTNNPEMKKATVEFKHLMGGTIRTKQ